MRKLRNGEVYYEKGRFGGWPANFGAWSWGDELLVGFARGYYKDLGEKRHNIDREKPEEHLFARSLNGGETWKLQLNIVNASVLCIIQQFCWRTNKGVPLPTVKSAI